MRPEVHALLGDMNSDIDHLIDLGEEDLVIVFTVMRYTKHTTAMASTMAERGAKMYAITDSLLSPLLQITDKAFLFPNRSLGVVPSLVSVFSFLHLVVAAASTEIKHDAVKQRLDILESLYSSYGMVSDDMKAAGMFGWGRDESE
jgi:DNA-binding MurR/RpiR family transcriptional regulator